MLSKQLMKVILRFIEYLINILNKLYDKILIKSNRGIKYHLFTTNVNDNLTDVIIFIFEYNKPGNIKDLIFMLNIIINGIEDIDFKFKLTYKMIFYKICDTGYSHPISKPFIFNLKYKLYGEELINEITWTYKPGELNSEIIVIIYRK